MGQKPDCCIWWFWSKFKMALWRCNCWSGATEWQFSGNKPTKTKCCFFSNIIFWDVIITSLIDHFNPTSLSHNNNSSILMLQNILFVGVMFKIWVWIQTTLTGWVVCLGSLPRWGLCFGSVDLAHTNCFQGRFQDTSEFCFSYCSSAAVWAADKCSSNTRVSTEG